jgi:hypothetical protein
MSRYHVASAVIDGHEIIYVKALLLETSPESNIAIGYYNVDEVMFNVFRNSLYGNLLFETVHGVTPNPDSVYVRKLRHKAESLTEALEIILKTSINASVPEHYRVKAVTNLAKKALEEPNDG